MSGVWTQIECEAKSVVKAYNVRPVTVEVNPRLRTTAGYAHGRTRVIELAAWLFAAPDEDILETFRHELAHILSGDIYGTSVAFHGYEWRTVCKAIGSTGARLYPARLNEYNLRSPR